MNRYQIAMNRCVPPDGFEARLHAKVLAEAAREPGFKPYRPLSFARKLLLTVLIALALTVSVGAAVVAIPWDQIFLDRFGSDEATASLGEAAFQDVHVSSVCGDTTLTIRQAMGDTKTIYIILDITLPERIPMAEALAEADADDGAYMMMPTIDYYATGEVSWADIRGKSYQEAQAELERYRFPGGASASVAEKNYDADTNTLTLLISFSTESTSKNLTDQPLTLLVGGMQLMKDGQETALFEGPFLITFEPAYTAQAIALTLTDADGNVTGKATLSPFALQAEVWSSEYTSFDDFYRDITLVYRDGSAGLPDTAGCGGGAGKPGDSPFYTEISIQFRFRKILDLSDVAAVRIGDYEAALP